MKQNTNLLRKLGIFLASIFLSISAEAVTISVTTAVDVVDGTTSSIAALQTTPGGAGISLREAVRAVNNDAGGPHTISIPAGTYTLSLTGADDTAVAGDLDVLKGVTISGAGSAATIIRGGTTIANGVDKIFSLNPLGNLPGFPVSISGVTLRFGRNTDANFAGGNSIGGAMDFDAGFGANFNGLGTLTLNDVIFDQNSTTNGDGGALALFDGGTVNVTNCQFTANRANSTANIALGGAIFAGFANSHAISYNFTSCLISGNATAGTTPSNGGGVFSFTGGLSFHACTIMNNSTGGPSSDGGGIASQGPLTIDQGTIVSGNTAARWGGGIFVNGTTATISNSTIASNTSGSNGGLGGGGIFTNAGTTTVSNCRIVGNSATGINATGGSQLGTNTGNAGTTMNAANNWFGTNAPPASFFGSGVTASPNLVLAVAASPTSVNVGQTSTVTASITRNSNSQTGFTVPNGTPVTFSAVLGNMSPTSGTLTSGTLNSTFTGTSGGAGSATATVDSQSLTANITVTQPAAITSANNTTFTVGTNGSFTVTKTGSPSPTLSVSGALPTGVTFTPATGILSGIPAAGTGGSYPLTFTASNGVGSDALQTFTLRVSGPPVVSNIAKSGNEDTQITFTASNFDGGYSDPNADVLATVRVTSLPANGTLKLSGVNVTVNQDIPRANLGNLTFDPAPNFNGGTSFGWNGSDGAFFAASAALVNVTVTAVNDAPVITGQAVVTTPEDTARAIAFTDLLVTDVDNPYPTGFILTVMNGANYTHVGNTITPALNFNGTLTVPVMVNDGAANSNVLNLSVTVTPVNDAPVITGQAGPIALAANHSRTIFSSDLIVTDVDNTCPTGFTLTVSNGANYTRTGATITPTPGFVGTLTVPVQVNDSAANSNLFNLTVTVNPTAEQVATNATIAPEPGGGFRVGFLGAPSATYTIQFAPNLSAIPINWQTLGTATASAANGRYSIVDIPPANTPMRYYRSTEAYLNDFLGLGKATLRGTAVLANGGVKLTDETTGGFGAVVFDGIATSPALTGFTARFNLALGPGTAPPADGASFAVGNLGAGAWGEAGPAPPNSLAVGFDTYENGPVNGAIGIRIWVNGTPIASNATNPYTNGATVPVEISYDTTNGLIVRYNSVLIFSNLPIPGFSFPAAGGFGIGARTGGLLERAVVDDVEITLRP